MLGSRKEEMRAFKTFVRSQSMETPSFCAVSAGWSRGAGKAVGASPEGRPFPFIPQLQAVGGFRVYPRFWGCEDKQGSYPVSPEKLTFSPVLSFNQRLPCGAC